MPRCSLCRLLAAAALTAAVAGCASWWDLGPEPDNFVGRGHSETLLTDPALHAVTPHVAGDDPGGGVSFPTASRPAPASMPAVAPIPAPAASATTASAASATTSPAASATTASAPASNAPETLSVQEAILAGLENNVNLRVQRLAVPIARTNEQSDLAAFDPDVTGSIVGGRSQSGKGIVDSIAANAGVTEFLPTGTSVKGTLSSANNFYSESNLNQSASLSVTQSLLRGAGLDVNLAKLRQAELSTKVSQYALRANAESLVASIEDAYWTLAFDERRVVIVQNALDVAQKQLDDTSTRVRFGRLADSELPAAQAQVATQRETLIEAKSTLETDRLTFLQLITPARRDFWNRSIALTTLPFIPQGTMDPVENHLQAALRFRPDLNESLLELQSNELQIVVTKNGLLPRLDLAFSLAKSGTSYSFGDSLAKGFDSPDYSVSLGVSGDWSPINRAAKASYRAAELNRESVRGALDNQRQVAEYEIRFQYIQVETTRRQIDAFRATREAQQATVEVQKGKLDAGNGTSLDWSIAQGNLLNAQLSEVQAVTNHLKALVELYRREGTLLFRRGLDAPGATPVTGPAFK